MQSGSFKKEHESFDRTFLYYHSCHNSSCCLMLSDDNNPVKICKECGKVFIAKKVSDRYCSGNCKELI